MEKLFHDLDTKNLGKLDEAEFLQLFRILSEATRHTFDDELEVSTAGPELWTWLAHAVCSSDIRGPTVDSTRSSTFTRRSRP